MQSLIQAKVSHNEQHKPLDKTLLEKNIHLIINICAEIIHTFSKGKT